MTRTKALNQLERTLTSFKVKTIRTHDRKALLIITNYNNTTGTEIQYAKIVYIPNKKSYFITIGSLTVSFTDIKLTDIDIDTDTVSIGLWKNGEKVALLTNLK